jgi:hypothetical protein
MRRYIRRIAHELNVPVTVRRVAGGVIFWRSTEEEGQQAQGIASRLQTAYQQCQTRLGRRPRGAREERDGDRKKAGPTVRASLCVVVDHLPSVGLALLFVRALGACYFLRGSSAGLM